MLDPHQKQIEKLMRANAHRYRLHEVFRDFCELSACALSNAVDIANKNTRENRYMDIVKRYEPEEVKRFPHMMAELAQSLQFGFKDSLGELFMCMELSDHWKGQFFTPFHLAALMGRMSLQPEGELEQAIQSKGFVTVSDPACGAGSMLIGMAEAMFERKHNFQKIMHATAQDVCATAVHMCYIQLSLYHIPGVVIHGNTLSMEIWGRWFTPAHILGLWNYRLRAAREQAQEPVPKLEQVPEIIVAPGPINVEQLALL